MGENRHLDTGAVYQERRFFRAVEVAAAGTLTGDHLATSRGDVVIHPINHATLVVGWNGRTIYVDPVGGAAPVPGVAACGSDPDHASARGSSGCRDAQQRARAGGVDRGAADAFTVR